MLFNLLMLSLAAYSTCSQSPLLRQAAKADPLVEGLTPNLLQTLTMVLRLTRGKAVLLKGGESSRTKEARTEFKVVGGRLLKLAGGKWIPVASQRILVANGDRFWMTKGSQAEGYALTENGLAAVTERTIPEPYGEGTRRFRPVVRLSASEELILRRETGLAAIRGTAQTSTVLLPRPGSRVSAGDIPIVLRSHGGEGVTVTLVIVAGGEYPLGSPIPLRSRAMHLRVDRTVIARLTGRSGWDTREVVSSDIDMAIMVRSGRGVERVPIRVSFSEAPVRPSASSDLYEVHSASAALWTNGRRSDSLLTWLPSMRAVAARRRSSPAEFQYWWQPFSTACAAESVDPSALLSLKWHSAALR